MNQLPTIRARVFGRAWLATLVASIGAVGLVTIGIGTGNQASSSEVAALAANQTAGSRLDDPGSAFRVSSIPISSIPISSLPISSMRTSRAHSAPDLGVLGMVLPRLFGRSDAFARPWGDAAFVRRSVAPADASDVALDHDASNDRTDAAGITHPLADGSGRLAFYNGRPIRPVATRRMKVTAYSPDFRSCGASADGITASGYSVLTNGGCMVAADPRVLPLGSLVSVPGYDDGAVVPVLDTGGAIKGERLDVLYATHEIAMRWGIKEVDVTVWEFADGLPNGFRRLRRP